MRNTSATQRRKFRKERDNTMKRYGKKIMALGLAGAMVFGMSITSFAAEEPATLIGGEIGGYTSPDTQNLDNKKIKIEKDLIIYNPDETLIYGPAITYTYTVAEGTAGVSITDAPGDHNSNLSTSTTTRAGLGVGTTLKVNDEVSRTGTISWANSEVVDASREGTPNKKYLELDFTDVVFTQPGVYRYQISEEANAYTTSGVKETSIGNEAASHVRYLDVYVMRSGDFDATHDGTQGHEYVAGDWKIYGYVCVYNDNTAIVDGDTYHAVKTNGFVSGTTNGTDIVVADEYHTYNLTVGKTLESDATMETHKFPFDVTWTAGTATGSFRFAVESSSANVTTSSQGQTTTANGTNVGADTIKYTYNSADNAEYALTSADKDGTPSIANGGTVKYIGIPTGTKATVTETNDVNGTTYATRVYAGTWTDTYATPTTQVAFTGGTSTKGDENEITNAVATMAYGKTAIYAQKDAPAADMNQAIQFTNTASIISPTGLVIRFAPYIIIFGAAIVLFAFTRRRRYTDEA